MLVDEAHITVVSGQGGSGRASFYVGRGKPSGGDGGKGGSVYAVVDPSLSSLYKYVERKKFEAESGNQGETFSKQGKDAPDITLSFPRGTELHDEDTGAVIDLDISPAPLLLVDGGRGGWGNSRINMKNHHVFAQANEGRYGETRRFRIHMRLIADIGLIGYPNAGKSSLLNVLTAAQARVADYPFTTLEPNLGVLSGTSGASRVVIADIPGLIEGASLGKGLGHKFLKHVEKVKLLLHCISCESPDLAKDYQSIRHELSEYNQVLGTKPELVIVTKSDLAPRGISTRSDYKALKSQVHHIMIGSIIDDAALLKVRSAIIKLMSR